MITLDYIKALPEVVEDLAWPFDFSLTRADGDNDWVKLKPEQPFTVIAGECTGGVFIAYGDGAPETLPLLHATSEGQAGRVASNLTEWLGILMAIPYWRDLLGFSGGGQLAEMRKMSIEAERECAVDYPDLSAVRERISDALEIPELHDPIQVLHDNVHATNCVLVAEDGWEYETLFGEFKYK